jgi:hypothetical protein
MPYLNGNTMISIQQSDNRRLCGLIERQEIHAGNCIKKRERWQKLLQRNLLNNTDAWMSISTMNYIYAKDLKFNLSAMKLSFVVVDGKHPLKDHFPDTVLKVSHLLEIWDSCTLMLPT